MKKSQADATTARNLEENEARGQRDMAGKAERVTVERCGKRLRYKFDRGENELDYFDVRKARIIDPQSKRSSAKTKFPFRENELPNRAAVVREKSARYLKKTG
jgi:hypothetical protein